MIFFLSQWEELLFSPTANMAKTSTTSEDSSSYLCCPCGFILEMQSLLRRPILFLSPIAVVASISFYFHHHSFPSHLSFISSTHPMFVGSYLIFHPLSWWLLPFLLLGAFAAQTPIFIHRRSSIINFLPPLSTQFFSFSRHCERILHT